MKRDFRYTTRLTILARVTERTSDSCFTNISDWNTYSKWLDELSIEPYLTNINTFHGNVVEKNIAAKKALTDIFDGVNEASDSYLVRLAAVKTNLENYRTTIQALSEAIDPANGLFSTGHVKSNLVESVNKYIEEGVILSQLAEGDLDIEQFTGVDKDEDYNVLMTVIGTIVDNLPKAKVNGPAVEISVGSIIIYYKIASEAGIGNSTVNLDLVADAQKLIVKEYSLSTKIGTSQGVVGALNSEDVAIGFSNGTVEYNFSVKDSETLKIKSEIDENTHVDFKIKNDIDGISAEVSVKTDLQDNSITSTMGVKKTKSYDVQNVNMSESEPEVYQMPVIENKAYNNVEVIDSDINWETIGTIGAGVLVVIGGLIYLYVSGGDPTVFDQGIQMIFG